MSISAPVRCLGPGLTARLWLIGGLCLAACDDEEAGSRPADTSAEASADDGGRDIADFGTGTDAPTDSDDPQGDAQDVATDGSAEEVVADVPGDDAGNPDADGGTVELPGEDATGDVAGDTAGNSDADVSTEQCSGGNTCSDLESRLECTWDAVSECQRSSQCALRYNPTCPLGGCFTYHSAAADLADLSALETAYDDESCAEAVCRCAAPPDTLSCTDGHCGACPETCPYTCAMDCACYVDACGCDQPVCLSTLSCQDQLELLEQAADDVAGCSRDEDCGWVGSPICPELGCSLTVNTSASTAQLQSLVDAYIVDGCHGVECACILPPDDAVVACIDSRCQFVEP